ncbi:hypothetical protein D3C79_983080 [compost metagenome]
MSRWAMKLLMVMMVTRLFRARWRASRALALPPSINTVSPSSTSWAARSARRSLSR